MIFKNVRNWNYRNYKSRGISNNICVTNNKRFYLNSKINYNIN